jgi:hypothetical protein
MTMEEERTANMRPLLVVLAVAFAAASIWAATALGGGGSAPTDSTTGNDPVAGNVQDDSAHPAAGDCPADGNGSGNASGESTSAAL